MPFAGMPSQTVTYAQNPVEQQLSPPSKKAKATPKKDRKIEEAVIGTKGPQTAPDKKGLAKKDQVIKKPSVTTKAVAAKQDKPVVQKETTVKKQPASKKEPSTKQEAEVKEESTAKTFSAAKKQPAMKQEITTKEKVAVKAEKPDSYLWTGNIVSSGLITGYYNIECPTLEEQFGDNFDPDGYSLRLGIEGPRIWGAYHFGQFSGILLLENRLHGTPDKDLPVKWRGREEGEGEESFGDNCYGHIAFQGNGRITGMLNLFGDCEFFGREGPGPGTGRFAENMRQEWESFITHDYSYKERAEFWYRWR